MIFPIQNRTTIHHLKKNLTKTQTSSTATTTSTGLNLDKKGKPIQNIR